MSQDVTDKLPTLTRVYVYTNTYTLITSSNISTTTISRREDMHDNTHIQTVAKDDADDF